MAPQHVLIVDDEPPIRKMVSAALRAAGHTAVAVASQAEALETIAAQPPDLVICDIYMNGGDGFDTLARVRAQQAHAQIPFILMTGQFEPHFLRRGTDLGAVDFLIKPFSPQQLQATVTACMRRSRPETDAASTTRTWLEALASRSTQAQARATDETEEPNDRATTN